MINSKTCTIAGKDITIRELTLRDLIEAPEQVNTVNAQGVPYLLLRCIDCSIDDISDMTFAEMELLESEFMELNAAFFRRAGMAQSLPA